MHITLGVFLKLFNSLEETCHTYGIDIAVIMVKAMVEVDSDFGDHVQSLRRLRELQTNLAMKQNHLIDYQEAANWFAISNGNDLD